jgi:hypothetical protein
LLRKGEPHALVLPVEVGVAREGNGSTKGERFSGPDGSGGRIGPLPEHHQHPDASGQQRTQPQGTPLTAGKPGKAGPPSSASGG